MSDDWKPGDTAVCIKTTGRRVVGKVKAFVRLPTLRAVTGLSSLRDRAPSGLAASRINPMARCEP